MARTAELIMGIFGGVFGLLGSILSVIIGALALSFGTFTPAIGIEEIGMRFLLALIASIVGLVGAGIVNSHDKRKIGGSLMLVSAIVGVATVGVYYLLAAILLGISGTLALVNKK